MVCSSIEGTYNAGIQTNRLTIAGVGSTGVAIGTDGITGIVTYFKVIGDLSYPSIRENDILSVGTEKIKVLKKKSHNIYQSLYIIILNCSIKIFLSGFFFFEASMK